jgi:hypothetical protein
MIVMMFQGNAEDHSGTILSNQTWTLANSPHYVVGNVTISDLCTVTIEPGCSVYFSGNYRILVNGALSANGTAENQILFTSNQPVPANGDWRAIVFQNTDPGCILNYCNIRYGGSDQAMVRIFGSTNYVIISNCVISNSLSYGIQLADNAANPSISNCSVFSCSTYPIYTRADRAKDITGTMTFSDNNPDAIWVTTGNISTGQWLNHGVPWVLGDGNFIITDGSVLTIDPGNTIKMDGNRQLEVRGSLLAKGSGSNQITFTSNEAVPAPGNWQNIYFNAVDNISELSFCNIFYGGSVNGAIYTFDNTYWWVRVLFCEIAYSASYGIFNNTNSTAEMVVCDIHDCNDFPIRTGANSVGRISDYCSFTNNANNAIRVDGQNISGNWTWVDNDIPFVIWTNTTLNDGRTLELSPGVEVRFNAQTMLLIGGKLIANGEPGNRIIFTSNQSVPTPGYWDRLYLYNADPGTVFNYCDISYGGSVNCNLDIRACGDNVSITNTTVRNSSTDGVRIREISNPHFINSTIKANGNIGIYISGSCLPTFGSDETEWNEIFNNTGYELRNGTLDIEAKYIYWGSTACSDVEVNIYDKEDNATLGTVNYSPWISDLHLPVSSATVWTGAVNNNWNNNGNWTNNSPCLAMDVSIPKAPAIKPVISTANEKCHDLTIEAGSRLTLNSGRTLGVNGDFRMEAGAAGTASFVENGGFTVAQNTTMQFYVEADRYIYISAPMVNQTAVTFMDMYLWSYDEPADFWNQIYLPEDPLEVGKGYELWSSSMYPLPNPPGTKTVEYSGGTFNSGTFILPVSFGNTGWNMVGNPYPSAVDWDFAGWIKSQLDATVYVWDGVQFLTWNGSVGDLTNGIIPAMQAFFVKANGANPGLAISNSTRVHGSDPYKEGIAENILELMVTGNNYYDRSFIYFNENATAGFDSQFDAYKLPGLEGAPQLYTKLGDIHLKVNALKEITSGLTVPISLEVSGEGEYTLFVDGLSNFTVSTGVFIEDLKEDLMIDLAVQSDYTFNATPIDAPDRFVLHFGATGIGDQNATANQFSIYSYENNIYLRSEDGQIKNGSVNVYDVLGQLVISSNLDGSILQKISLEEKSGYFIVSVNADSFIATQKVLIQ